MTDEFDDWIDRARRGDLGDADVARLAERLAASGDRVDVAERSADVASTGGPGSLSTLWAPPALVASGFKVPKLGVPGRPAGGIDVLVQLPGYLVDLDRRALQRVLDQCGYAHVLAGTNFAPADAAMFAYRQRVGAQSLPALAIASLLSKKLAMGVRNVGLDVRVSRHGNFGTGREPAACNARMFVRVAELLGIRAICFLTDGSIPQQPYLGRGESLAALFRLLAGTASAWLQDHAATCEGWASTLCRSGLIPAARIADAFAANITAQGASMDMLERKAALVEAEHTRRVLAEREGIVSYDLGGLRQAILNARAADEGLTFDDSAGLILLVEPGMAVRAGEPLVSARCPDEAWRPLREAVAAAIRFSDHADAATPQRTFGTLEMISVGGR
jgi:pyrimidine-nucleoside phosphorylase